MIKTRTGMMVRACRYVMGTSVSVILLGLMINTIGDNNKGAYADNPAAVVDTLTVTVDSNCRISQSGGGSYTKTLDPGSTGTVAANTITAVCNDAGGYAIYAIGYSGDSFSGNNTDLISNDNANWNIKTDGSYQGSYWKVQFAASGQATVTSPYTTYQPIPASYAKVASYNQYTTSGTITPTYQIHLGQGQPAGTYTGKVQYVLVNPSNAEEPYIVPTHNLTVVYDSNIPNIKVDGVSIPNGGSISLEEGMHTIMLDMELEDGQVMMWSCTDGSCMDLMFADYNNPSTGIIMGSGDATITAVIQSF